MFPHNLPNLPLLSSDMQSTQRRIDDLVRLILADNVVTPEISAYLDTLIQQIETEFERRDRVLAAVHNTCTRLMRAPHWQSEVNEILRELGEASDTDRVTIFQLFVMPDNRLSGDILFGWDRTGIDLMQQPAFRHLDIAERGLAPLVEHIRGGSAYYFAGAELARHQLLAPDTKAGLAYPIFVNRELWGVFNYSITREPRPWTATELNALQIAADVLGAAIERQQAEHTLKQNEERLRQTVRLARLGVWDWNPITDQVEWNDEMFRIYGITRENFTGKGSDYIHFTRADYRAEQIENIRGAFAHGMTVNDLEAGKPFDSEPRELCIVRPDGTECYTIGDAVSIIDSEGKPLRMLGVTLDITERKEAEIALRERDRLRLALEKEHEISAIKTRVMRTISHEFRTPLSVILSASSMLLRYANRLSPEQQEAKLKLIETQVQHLDLLVREVAAVVHERSEQQQFQPRLIELEKLCRAIISELESTLARNHRMEFVSDGQLKTAFADERLIHRILINLLSNAVKYSPEGSAIQLRLRREPDAMVFEIEDHGIGIPPDEQVRLFEPFFRGSNIAGISGTGLGLSIVFDCVTQHGGQISVRSAVGSGTMFTVRLPIVS